MSDDSGGIVQVYPPLEEGKDSNCREDFDLDVVLVHGLGGDSVSTWTDNTTYWPKDLLPSSQFYKNARILTFGYNTKAFLNASGGSHDRTFTCAEALVFELDDNRIADPSRPLIFVGHSLGGIVIKSAIRYAFIQPDMYGSIVDSTKAIVFFSTPHQGADAGAWKSLFDNFEHARIQNAGVVQELTLWSSMLVELTTGFAGIARGIQITTFFETIATNGVVIVGEGSARMGLQVERTRGLVADHLGICKFTATDQKWKTVRARFIAIAQEIRRLAQVETLPAVPNDRLRCTGDVESRPDRLPGPNEQ
ncbi:hypothetical protein BDV10DRAFT_164963 [Aspergillus recurvatus]